MAKFSVLQAGDDDDEFGSNGRSMTPYQKRRELARGKAEVDGAYELYVKQLSAINRGMQHKLSGIALTAVLAEDTARRGPIQAALSAEAMASYSALLKVADFRFGSALQD
jgi:hypothetical protein